MIGLRNRKINASNSPNLVDFPPLPPAVSPCLSTTTVDCSATPTTTIHASTTASFQLLSARSTWRRLDVAPFAMLYTCLLFMDHYHFIAGDFNHHSKNVHGQFRFSMNCAWCFALVLHVATVVAGTQSVRVRAQIGYFFCNDDHDDHYSHNDCDYSAATHVWIRVPDGDQQGIVSITTTNLPNNDNHNKHPPSRDGNGMHHPQQQQEPQQQQIEFQHRVFRRSTVWPDDDVRLWMTTMTPQLKLSTPNGTKTKPTPPQVQPRQPYRFRPLFYPTALTLDFYKTWRGHEKRRDDDDDNSLPSPASIIAAVHRIYGPNRTTLSLPTFAQLLMEQLQAPFFLFQLLCVVLWSLDEYWYYAMYTLVALVIFESTVAYNRLSNLQRLRQAGNHGEDPVQVWRHQMWIVVQSHELVPGDLIRLSAASTHSHSHSHSSANAISPTQRRMRRSHSTNTPPTATIIPADILLLRGSAVVDEALLTGESIPHLKHELSNDKSDYGFISSENTTGSSRYRNDENHSKFELSSLRLDLKDSSHKESILFAGTRLIAVTLAAEDLFLSSKGPRTAGAGFGRNDNGSGDGRGDDAVIGMVIRTGFETLQGSLLRTMATATHHEGVHNSGTFVFLFTLVVCAMGAAWWVWTVGSTDDRRNQFKLILHIIILITSVVPPELPMELSLAVTNSVARLIKRYAIYCTEPFRIPIAGQVNVCCFDKTGTLTSDEMRLRGVALVPKVSDTSNEEEESLVVPGDDNFFDKRVPLLTLRIMAACHSLAVTRSDEGTNSKENQKSNFQIIGDPLEVAVFKHTGFHMINSYTVSPHNGCTNQEAKTMKIRHRFTFSSKFKRMSTIISEKTSSSLWVLCKGAPETVKDLCNCASVPENYLEIANRQMNRGRRVLAMACRHLEGMSMNQLTAERGREIAECNLEFAGFLVFDCPIKHDSKAVICELRESRHRVVMITGDALLTSMEVARQVGIVNKSVDSRSMYQIEPKLNSSITMLKDALCEFECVPLFPSTPLQKSLSLSQEGLLKLFNHEQDGLVAFCMTGENLSKLAIMAFSTSQLETPETAMDEKNLLLHPKVQTFLASVLPLVTVFARHAPHQKEAVIAAFNRAGLTTCMCGDGTNDVGALKRASVGISIVSAPKVESKHWSATEKLHSRNLDKINRSKAMQELREAQEQLDRVELGDASIAAPFTSRQVSIKCCKDVIQQGRCTLVSVLTIYKILGVNCLVNALVLSKLFLHGVKQGDRQLTFLGVIVAALFYFVTRSEPLSTLSHARPPSSVISKEALVSIVGQFTVHCTAILLATRRALEFPDEYDPSLVPDSPFNPNPLNTCAYLLLFLTTINTFAVNYRGRPFMEDLQSNVLLYRTLQICYITLVTCVLEAFPPLNDLLQLTSLRKVNASESAATTAVALMHVTDYPTMLLGLMIIDTAAVFAIERLIHSSSLMPMSRSALKRLRS